MTDVLGLILTSLITGVFTCLFMSEREPYLKAAAWNKGYGRGIEQGLAEARDPQRAPIRIEMEVR